VAAFTPREGALVEIDFPARNRANRAELVGSVHDAIRALGPSSLPLTSSGKVRRRHCRELYLTPQLQRAESDAAAELTTKNCDGSAGLAT
jgi:hypothetical protein